MKLIRNTLTALQRPGLALEYLQYLFSRARNGGQAVRTFPDDGFEVGGFSGFGEFHTCVKCISGAERQFLAEFPFGEGAILDVGGNLGIFSLMVAGRFPDRKIHAFEPNPTTYAALCANFARNHCANARAHPQAVAATVGEIAFQADPINRATTHIASGEPQSGREAPLIHVPCVTLDAFVGQEKIGSIGLLKVDVEGYEELVFRGAERLLAEARANMIYYEVCPDMTRRAGFAPEDASRRLLSHGYRLHALSDGIGLQPTEISRIPAIDIENWVAIRD